MRRFACRAAVIALPAWLSLLAGVGAGCGGPACAALQHTDPTRVITEQAAKVARVSTLRGEAKVDQRGPEGRVRGKVMMFLARPSSVRFDAVTQFGPALVLTSDGDSLALSDFKENRYFTGPACARNVARMIGVALAAEDVVSVLFGDAPRLSSAKSSIQCSKAGGYRIDQFGGDGERQELEFALHADDFDKPPEMQRLALIRAERFDAKKRPIWRVRYDDYRSVKGGARLPFRVHVEDLRHGADAVLRFESIEVNVKIPEGAFSQTPRPGLRVEDVTCE